MESNLYVYVVIVDYGNQYISKEEIGGIFTTREKAQEYRKEMFENGWTQKTRIVKYLVDANDTIL